jgi:hypothetical protein
LGWTNDPWLKVIVGNTDWTAYQAARFCHAETKKGESRQGQPVTGDEFDWMMAAVDKVRPEDAEAWQRYLARHRIRLLTWQRRKP